MTIPVTTAVFSRSHDFALRHPDIPISEIKMVPYLSFPVVVGKNSNFRHLSEEELDELAGVEYRALNALIWIVGTYHIVVQIIAFIVIWPYIARTHWRSVLDVPQLHRHVSPGWFSAFQVASSYTNTGMSLVDQSMVPFQKAYPLVFLMTFLIMAGNTAFVSYIVWLPLRCVSLMNP
jgi:Trk-type K+ transport system membrane component